MCQLSGQAARLIKPGLVFEAIARFGWGIFFACLTLVLPLCADARLNSFDNHARARRLAWHACGLAHKGQIASASKEFDTAIALAPRDEMILVSKAQTLFAARCEWVRAIEIYTEALAINPSNVDALALRAIAFEFRRDNRAALCDFDRAIKIAPKDARTYDRRGINLLRQRRYKQALLDFEKAISLDPNNAFYLDDKADTEFYLGRSEQSLKDNSAAIALKPNVAVFYETRGYILAELHRLNESIEAYDVAEQLGSTKIYFNRAQIKMDVGRYREALPDWQEEAKRDPERALLYKAKRGKCLVELKEWDEALVELNGAITEDYPFIYEWRAEVFYHQARYDLALKDYSKALTFFDNSGMQVVFERDHILSERSRTLEKLGKFDAAFKDLVAVLKTNSSNREIYFEFLTLAQNFLSSNSRTIPLALEFLIPFLLHRLFRRRRIRRLF